MNAAGNLACWDTNQTVHYSLVNQWSIDQENYELYCHGSVCTRNYLVHRFVGQIMITSNTRCQLVFVHVCMYNMEMVQTGTNDGREKIG